MLNYAGHSKQRSSSIIKNLLSSTLQLNCSRLISLAQPIAAEKNNMSSVMVELNQRLYTIANLRKMNKNTKVENRIATLGFTGALMVGKYHFVIF